MTVFGSATTLDHAGQLCSNANYCEGLEFTLEALMLHPQQGTMLAYPDWVPVETAVSF